MPSQTSFVCDEEWNTSAGQSLIDLIDNHSNPSDQESCSFNLAWDFISPELIQAWNSSPLSSVASSESGLCSPTIDQIQWPSRLRSPDSFVTSFDPPTPDPFELHHDQWDLSPTSATDSINELLFPTENAEIGQDLPSMGSEGVASNPFEMYYDLNNVWGMPLPQGQVNDTIFDHNNLTLPPFPPFINSPDPTNGTMPTSFDLMTRIESDGMHMGDTHSQPREVSIIYDHHNTQHLESKTCISHHTPRSGGEDHQERFCARNGEAETDKKHRFDQRYHPYLSSGYSPYERDCEDDSLSSGKTGQRESGPVKTPQPTTKLVRGIGGVKFYNSPTSRREIAPTPHMPEPAATIAAAGEIQKVRQSLKSHVRSPDDFEICQVRLLASGKPCKRDPTHAKPKKNQRRKKKGDDSGMRKPRS